MTQQVIDIGSAPDDSTGDPLRTSFDKTNDNFTELYAKGATEGLWNYNQTSIDTSTAPVSGRFKTNSGNYRAATQIAIHAITIQGIDRSSTLRTLLVGDLIQCQDKSNAGAWCRYSLQSLPVDHGTWFQLNVTFQADGGVASGDNQEIVFVFTASSGSAAAGAPVGAEYITSTADAALTAERVLTDTATVTWDRTTAGQIKASSISAVMKGYILGLTLSNDVAFDSNNNIAIAPGEATSTEATPVVMVLAAQIIKRIVTAWAVGNVGGGLDTGAVAAGWYYVWLIQRSDTGVVDALFSLSATAPTMPANYNRKRRIGSIRYTGSSILPFSQSGDEFLFKTTIGDVSVSTAIAGVAVLYTLTVPPIAGIRVLCNIAGTANATAATVILVSSPDQLDQIPNALSGNASVFTIAASTSNFVPVAPVRTVNGQIRARADAQCAAFYLATYGWTDERGRNV